MQGRCAPGDQPVAHRGHQVGGELADRARVVADPGPRQYCVRQGWLATAGAVAICAPNQVSLALAGRNAEYDSLSY